MTAKNQNTYVSDRPCSKGHVGLRYLAKHRCVECARQRAMKWAAKHPDVVRLRAAEHGATAKAKEVRSANYRKTAKQVKERVKQWRQANPAKVSEYSKRYCETSPQKRQASQRNWRKANLARCMLYVVQRKRSLRQATPQWANFDSIVALYELSRELTAATGVRHSVDHIIPIRGKTVCGLHVETNLRVITFSENASKGNRFDDLAA